MHIGYCNFKAEYFYQSSTFKSTNSEKVVKLIITNESNLFAAVRKGSEERERYLITLHILLMVSNKGTAFNLRSPLSWLSSRYIGTKLDFLGKFWDPGENFVIHMIKMDNEV